MSTLAWIVGGGLAMSAIALVGTVTLVLPAPTLKRLVLPLVALAAGTLIGGALFHMIPTALHAMGDPGRVFLWVLLGFALFFALEQFLHWHHCHRPAAECRETLSYLILLGDGLHNFLGGLAVGGAFLIDIRVGITAWIAAAAHEVPQELGDFGVLVHAGWSSRKALLFNVLSALGFLVGGMLAYVAAAHVRVEFLLPLAAGNFIYIAASDLVPEVNRTRGIARATVHFGAFLGGALLLYVLRHQY